MGEQKRLEQLRKYYLGMDYRTADTQTIKDAEAFFQQDIDLPQKIYIIPEENKICADFPFANRENEYIRYVYHRGHEVFYGDYDDDREYDIEPYGELFLEWMKETHKDLLDLCVLKGDHLEYAEERNLIAKDKIHDVKQELLKTHPYPSKNPLENEKHLIMLEGMAKENVLNDYVFVKPYVEAYELTTEELADKYF